MINYLCNNNTLGYFYVEKSFISIQVSCFGELLETIADSGINLNRHETTLNQQKYGWNVLRNMESGDVMFLKRASITQMRWFGQNVEKLSMC